MKSRELSVSPSSRTEPKEHSLTWQRKEETRNEPPVDYTYITSRNSRSSSFVRCTPKLSAKISIT